MGKFGMTNRRAAFMDPPPPPKKKNYINRGLAF